MNPRERVLRAVNHEETDLVPYNIAFGEETYSKLSSYYHDRNFTEKINNHFAIIGPAIYPFYDPDMVSLNGEDYRDLNRQFGADYFRKIEGKYYTDEFGSLWKRGNIFHIEKPPLRKPSLDDYQFPDLGRDEFYEHCEGFCEANRDKLRIFEIGLAFFERSWALRGFDNILKDMIRNPGFCHELYGRLADLHMDIIEKASQFSFDAVRFSDDFGQQDGLIMGPHHWRKYLKPHLEEMYRFVHEKGMYVSIHTDGDISEIFGELVEIGVDIFNPCQPEAMDIYEIKARYGDRMTINGGISSQATIPFGTPEEIREEIRDLIGKLGENGGFVIEPSKEIFPDTPPENADAVIDSLTNQRDLMRNQRYE